MLKFWKNISLFVQIAIVVSIILALSFFDPFGMFRSKKKSLTNTTISVQSIKEIGQYISAEYYGEVLTSLQETRLKQVKDSFKLEQGEFNALKNSFLEAMLELNTSKSELNIKWPRKGRKVQKVFYDNYSNITESPLYQTFISEMSGKKEKAFLKRLVLELDTANLRKEIDDKFRSVGKSLAEKLKEQLEFISADKKLQKSQIVVLARGWVKAGFDFESFTEDNFSYDEDKGIIHVINVKPEILHCDINPWFMPEEKIKGFEFVLITKRANDPQYVNEVKSYSLVKLRQMAIKADILKKAKENAETNLKYFFDLILDKPVNDVVIHDSYLSYFDTSFQSDSLTVWSMQSIDSMMMKHYYTDSAEIVKLRKELTRRKVFLSPKVGYEAVRYSSQLFRVLDSTFSKGDIAWLMAERDSIKSALATLASTEDTVAFTGYQLDRLDSIWYYPNEDVVDSFKVESNFHEYPTLWERKVSKQKAAAKKIGQLNTKLARRVYEHMFNLKMKDLIAYETIVSKQVNTVLKGSKVLLSDEKSKAIYDSIRSREGDDLAGLKVEFMSSALAAIDKDLPSLTSKDTLGIKELAAFSREVLLNWETKNIHAVSLRDTLIKISKNADSILLLAYPRYYSLSADSSLSGLAELESLYKQERQKLKKHREMLESKEVLDEKVFDQVEGVLKAEYIWYFPDREQQKKIRSNSKLPQTFSTFFKRKTRKKLQQQAFKLGVFQFMIDKSWVDMKVVRGLLRQSKEQPTEAD